MTEKLKLLSVELPDDLSWYFHPHFWKIDPLADCEEDRGYSKEEWQQLQDNGNIDITIDTSISLEEMDPDGHGYWTSLKPTPPTPEHFLIAAFDWEYSEQVYLWWAKPRKELPDSVIQSLKEVS